MKTWNKTLLLLLALALAVTACKPDDDDDDNNTPPGPPALECPDPSADNVSYVSEDPDACAAIKFFCDVGEAFSDACGCGCIAPEGPVSCGGWQGNTCADGEYCAYALDDICGWADAPGTCATVPEACTLQYDPVCGCDGQTYGNSCTAASNGVAVQALSACESDEPVACGGWLGDTCGDDEFCSFAPEAICGWADAPGTCETAPEACTLQYDPVCGCDGQTYGNACVANSWGVSVQYEGACVPTGPTGGQ